MADVSTPVSSQLVRSKKLCFGFCGARSAAAINALMLTVPVGSPASAFSVETLTIPSGAADPPRDASFETTLDTYCGCGAAGSSCAYAAEEMSNAAATDPNR